MSEVEMAEFTAMLVRRDDGWRIQFVYDDGTYQEQMQPPFETKDEAQAALDAWISQQQDRFGPLVTVMPKQ